MSAATRSTAQDRGDAEVLAAIASVERPHRDGPPPEMGWGSDAIAEILRRLGIDYIALNPGSSFRGLHDSIVNYLGNQAPQLALCLHEEHAVAIAHGYAKVTGRPMAVALHTNVGLMHATMALYNAFCDRVPMLVLGATGPVDAADRHAWIQWIHTAADQGALVRSFVKWDDQPVSIQAALASVVHGHRSTTTYPSAPVYVCLDSALQEAELQPPPEFPDVARHAAPAPPAPAADVARHAADLLREAQRPLLLVGRVGRSEAAWSARVRLAEKLGAAVLTDAKTAAAFPTAHPLHRAVPGAALTPSGQALVAEADVILSLDWIDLADTLRQAAMQARVIACTLDDVLHNGWSKDHFGLAPVDLSIAAHPDLLVDALDELIDQRDPIGTPRDTHGEDEPPLDAPGAEISVRGLAAALSEALSGAPSCLVRLPIPWNGADLRLEHPLDYLGDDGGAGLGSGPGLAVGAALGLAGTDRLAVAVLGDGDFLMGATALWSAARYRLPVLVVVANNGSYYNDEVHQEWVAHGRGRPVENAWIGQAIADPAPDLAALARSLGAVGLGPLAEPVALPGVLAEGVRMAREGSAVVVDVRVGTSDYPRRRYPQKTRDS